MITEIEIEPGVTQDNAQDLIDWQPQYNHDEPAQRLRLRRSSSSDPFLNYHSKSKDFTFKLLFVLMELAFLAGLVWEVFR